MNGPTPQSLLLTYVRPHWPALLGLLALLLLGTGLSLTLPQLLRAFVDTALAGEAGAQALLTRFALLYLAAAAGVQLSQAFATYLGAVVGWNTTNRLRADLMAHLLAQDMSYHKERTPGEMIERIDGDVTALSNFFSQFAVRVLGALLLLFGAIVMFMRENLWLGLGVLAFVAVTLAAMNWARKLGVEPTRKERAASAEMYGFVEERLSGLGDIRALGAGPYSVWRFLGVQGNFFRKGRVAWMRRSIVWQLSMALFAAAYVAVLAFSLSGVAAGAITVGTALMLYQYMTLVEEPVDQLTQQLQDLQKAAASVVRIGELLALRPEVLGGAASLPPGAPELRFEGVTFAYEAGQPVLREVSFVLPAGQTLGLLGRTGSGKSTLTRLVSRLYSPSSGRVLLGGVDITTLDLTELRRTVAVVSQEVQLFQASVRDNLSLFDPEVSDAAVHDALTRVGLGEWLARLQGGVHSPLPAGSLSAGEAQLLAFARVLLRGPRVVILDEPSSRLDPASEARLTGAMQELLRGRTAIVIAHRLDTVSRVDRILVLGSGEVLEFGERAALAEDERSHYAALLRAGEGAEELS